MHQLGSNPEDEQGDLTASLTLHHPGPNLGAATEATRAQTRKA